MNLQFGTGVMFCIPNAGNTSANPSPYKLGVLQENAIEFKADLKKLFGQSQFPIAKARGKIEVSGKAKFASLDPNMLNQLYFGQVQTGGMTLMAVDEAASIPATPFQITASHSAQYVKNYGVVFTISGQTLIKVASSPATGQYAVNEGTGVYTFAAADTGLGVKISYTYTDAARGTTVALANQLMGYAPEFRAFLFNNFRAKVFAVELYSCTMGQISIPTKQEDFWVSDITYDAGVDASDVLGQIYADF